MPIQSNQPESMRQWIKTGDLVKTASETPYCMIRHIFSRSWYCCKLLCKRSSFTQTTLAIDEWKIFWPSEVSPIEVGSTECSCHLVFESSLHVRLLPATLQYLCVSRFRMPLKSKNSASLCYSTIPHLPHQVQRMLFPCWCKRQGDRCGQKTQCNEEE